jgi:hypothetical protein
MPIPREQFQQRSDTTENNILNFLKEHPEEAYNAKEIAEAFGVIKSCYAYGKVLKFIKLGHTGF